MMKRFFSKHADTIRRWLTHRHLPLMLACVGIVLTLPALGTGLVFDDYFHRDILSGNLVWPPVQDASLFGLFSFADGTPEGAQVLREAGIAPWWMFEGIKMAFWRPLAEFTHWIDYQLWPDAPWLMHVHSLLWFGATIWVIATLYRRIIGSVWVAGLAGLLFTISGNHAFAAGFIAQRNTLIAAFFGSVALLAHVRWRQDGWRPGAVLAPLCYLLGLLGKESAIVIGAYLFAYTLFLDQGKIPPNPPFVRGGNREIPSTPPLQKGGIGRLDRVRRKATVFLPYFFVALGWYATYHYLGFGVQGLGAYVDPGREPLLFMKAVLERVPMLLMGQFTGLLAEIWAGAYFFLPWGNMMVWGLAAAVLVFMGLILLPLVRHDRVVRFWTVGMMLGLVPMCTAFPSSRLLLFITIGAMGIIARFLAAWFERPDWLPTRQIWKRPAHALCIMFVSIHLILAPLTSLGYTTGLGVAHYLIHRDTSAMPYDEDVLQKTAVLVNPIVEPVGAYISQVRTAYGYPVPARVLPLASGEIPLMLTRIDEHTIDIEAEQGLLQTVLGSLLRGPSHPMYVGQRIVLSDMSIEVLALADGWQPSRARFTFAVPLDDPSLLWFRWKREGPVPYTPPVVGESETLLTISSPS